MLWRHIRSQAVAALLAATCLAAPALAQTPASTPQDAAQPNRLALVIGEAGYVGAPLQTAGADAALIAKTLGAEGFDVTELHDLNTPDLAAGYQAFLAKVQAAPPGAAVMVYLAGLAVNVGCDDYLLPVDAEIKATADVPAISLSMTRVMSDLAQTPSQVRIVSLDGARPIPASVSAVAFPTGLIPLDPPAATSFALGAEIHDFEAPPKPGDVNDAYALALAGAVQQPFTDIDSTLRQTRVAAHQATAGMQTPWHASEASTPPFAFVLNVDPAQAQALSANLPSGAGPLDGLDPQAAYWAAIWRNTIGDYQNFLAAFTTTASPDQLARVQALLALLQQPNPICQAQAPTAPELLIVGSACPDGFLAGDGFCAPNWPYLPCPPETLPIFFKGRPVCRIVHVCPPELHPLWAHSGWRCGTPPRCRPGDRDCPTPRPTPKPTPTCPPDQRCVNPTPTPTPTPTCPPDRRCPPPSPTPTPLPSLVPLLQVNPSCTPGVNCPPVLTTPPIIRPIYPVRPIHLHTRQHPYYPGRPYGWYRDQPGYRIYRHNDDYPHRAVGGPYGVDRYRRLPY